MEDSILNSTKKILGISDDYDAFDIDIITHINSTLSIMNQLGVGPTSTFAIVDDTAEWADLSLPDDQMNLARSYMYLKVRALFDPPGTSYLFAAINQQIEEYETRLSYMRESTIPVPVPTISEEVSEWNELFALNWGSDGADQN